MPKGSKVPPLPKKPAVPKKGTSLRLPVDLLARLDAYAVRHGGKRTDAVVHLLRWALEQAGD
jgi:predicted DNA-binding protein